MSLRQYSAASEYLNEDNPLKHPQDTTISFSNTAGGMSRAPTMDFLQSAAAAASQPTRLNEGYLPPFSFFQSPLIQDYDISALAAATGVTTAVSNASANASTQPSLNDGLLPPFSFFQSPLLNDNEPKSSSGKSAFRKSNPLSGNGGGKSKNKAAAALANASAAAAAAHSYYNMLAGPAAAGHFGFPLFHSVNPAGLSVFGVNGPSFGAISDLSETTAIVGTPANTIGAGSPQKQTTKTSSSSQQQQQQSQQYGNGQQGQGQYQSTAGGKMRRNSAESSTSSNSLTSPMIMSPTGEYKAEKKPNRKVWIDSLQKQMLETIDFNEKLVRQAKALECEIARLKYKLHSIGFNETQIEEVLMKQQQHQQQSNDIN